MVLNISPLSNPSGFALMDPEFFLTTTFSSSPNEGNPAAVVFIDITRPVDFLKAIARNLNQPITAFVSVSPIPCVKPKTVAYGVRWLTSSGENIPVCGHGAVAAAKVIFNRNDVTPDTEIVEFHTADNMTLYARKLQGGFIETELPCGDTSEVSDDEYIRLSGLIARSCGRKLEIDYIGSGKKGFRNYLLIIFNESVPLEQLNIDGSSLSTSGFLIHVFSTRSCNGATRFISRMFAPGIVPGDEDHVCGSAHCLMMPYWCRKLGITSGQEVKARQVSARGGYLTLVWEYERRKIRLSGEVMLLGSGHLNLNSHTREKL